MAYFRRYLIFVLAVFSTHLLQAQPGPAGGKGQPRNLSLIGLVNPGADYSGLFLLNGEQPIPLDIKPGGRGKKLVLTKAAKDVVLARQGTDPATGKPAFLPVVSTPWPDPKSGDAVLIIGSAAEAKEIRALILDDSPQAFPLETTRVVNLTGATLYGKVDSFQGEFKHATASIPIPYPDLKKLPPDSLARYPFGFALKGPGGEYVKLGSGFWEAAAGRRSLVIIQPPLEAGTTKVRMRTIVDYPAPPPIPLPARR